jgi:hypothetical protein
MGYRSATGRALGVPSPRTKRRVEHVGVRVEESTLLASQDAGTLGGDVGSVEFAVAGTEVAGEFRCSECGYGAVVNRVLPPCPMCAGTVWESRGPVAPRLVG